MIKKENSVILVAVNDELPKSILPGWNIQYTGVGKINATYHATKSILTYKPDYVINYGSAGSLNPRIFGLQHVSKFLQRDMLAVPLGCEIGETPFDKINIITNGLSGISCSTGDNFVDQDPLIKSEIVDMEAYAIAKVCIRENVKFRCYKFVSDNADEQASNDWNINLKNGADLFKSLLLNHQIK